MSNALRSFMFPGLMLIILFASGCKATRTSGETKRLKSRTASELFDALQGNYLDVDWLTARVKLHVDSEMGSLGFTSHLRMRTDSVIWFNIKKLGIEVSRGMITPDSFFFIDRLNRIYMKDAVGIIESEFELPFTFERLQTFILGNPDQMTAEMEVGQTGGRYALTIETETERHNLFLNGKSLLMEQQIMYDLVHEQLLSSDYVSYSPVLTDKKFALERLVRMEMNGSEPVIVEVTFNNVEFNTPKSMPFSIPTHYERMVP